MYINVINEIRTCCGIISSHTIPVCVTFYIYYPSEQVMTSKLFPSVFQNVSNSERLLFYLKLFNTKQLLSVETPKITVPFICKQLSAQHYSLTLLFSTRRYVSSFRSIWRFVLFFICLTSFSISFFRVFRIITATIL